MAYKNMRNIWIWFCLGVAGVLFISSIQSCGKSGAASAAGLNIQYEILNLSPNLGYISLYIDYNQVNSLTTPYIYGVNSGYFYVPSVDIPYQFRPFIYNGNSGTTLFSRSDSLKTGLKYSLFITGTAVNGVPQQLFTVDTATEPAIGRAKIRFVNVSPSATGGLDMYANGTLAFGAQLYPTNSKFIEVPVGNYDIQIKAAGGTAILSEQSTVTVQDGRLYTIYAYGYTTRSDSAAFNSGFITNK
ncbi:uncharacterized protein DUF4397 [Mucilaginibacter frigoritolerans]|uniref:Uncharacterized protein DUF4397 n=1 Tax=Mucilaginibacter frigoritolerans TaxID=652788 RepID=A0A562U9Q2_9SPHI|nr:DUF4397 domain-containing protein [Mucilaginibacter frigoritolerans]TWJ02556.1 uncharacterized protein DUF4397 [Mucilaginibacter frigoritolerans]